MMFDVSRGDFPDARPTIFQARGYTGWVPEITGTGNIEFLSHFKKENNKEGNIFNMQAWEVMILLINYLKGLAEKRSVTESLDNLKSQPLNSPRGQLLINEKNIVTGPAYLVSGSKNMEIVIEDVIEDIVELWKEMIMQVPENEFSTWQNTYLCI